MAISPAKAKTGKDTPMGEKENMLMKQKGVAPKVSSASKMSDDGGVADMELDKASKSLYDRAVNNSGGTKNADDALKSR